MEPTDSARTPWRNALLAVAAVVVPLLALELALRPFAELEPDLPGVYKTTIFEPDAKLGWKLRPGAEDQWGGVRVAINAKGLRGPELDYAKPLGVRRILYLGDSVPFGYKIERTERTFPYRVEAVLERGGLEVETVDGGVGGYSPWQSARFLADEGIRYEPDLVVVSFVLNDVTEKFDLVRFGGSSEGFQLARSARSTASRWLAKTAIGYFGRRWVARLRFGDDVASGARELAALRAQSLALEPDSEAVGRAWEITLRNLDEIFAFCDARGIPALLVAFPYTFQLDDPSDPDALGAPQRRLAAWAARRGVAWLDLLPVYAAALARSGGRAGDFFLDDDHPNPRGHALAAGAIADAIGRAGWLRDAAGGATGRLR